MLRSTRTHPRSRYSTRHIARSTCRTPGSGSPGASTTRTGEGNRGRQATDEKPEWAVPFDWTSAWQRWAHVLFNGAMVWQLSYAYINAGAGVDGILPWPRPVFSEDWQPGEGSELTGHETTRWEVEFARLLNETQRNDAFGFDAALQALDWSVRDVPPISAELARW